MSNRVMRPELSNPAATASGTSRCRPRPVVASAVLQLLVGTVTSVAGVVFSAVAGGGWYLATVCFAVALPLWWTAAIGLLRGSRRAHRLGFGLLGALLAFDSVKIVVFHEGAGYLFACLTVLGLSLQAALSTRRFVR